MAALGLARLSSESLASVDAAALFFDGLKASLCDIWHILDDHSLLNGGHVVAANTKPQMLMRCSDAVVEW